MVYLSARIINKDKWHEILDDIVLDLEDAKINLPVSKYEKVLYGVYDEVKERIEELEKL